MRDDLNRGIGPWDTGYDDARSATRATPGGVPVGGGMSEYMGRHAGRGPRSYQRSDDRIMDEICERLTWDPDVDATDIQVRVEGGLVTLSGTIDERSAKRRAEDLACDIRGVKDVNNELRIQPRAESATGLSGMPATPVQGIGAAGITGQGDGTTATSGGSIAGVADMPRHNNPEKKG
jgi:hypothetical protein